MTVEELLQKLVELAKEGKGQWRVYDWIGDPIKEVVEDNGHITLTQ